MEEQSSNEKTSFEEKMLFVLLILGGFLFSLVSFSCTENSRARSFGGKQTIYLNPGEKLINATWKETDLWYLTEPMPAEYTPRTINFIENSSFGIMEDKVTFIEQPYQSQR